MSYVRQMWEAAADGPVTSVSLAEKFGGKPAEWNNRLQYAGEIGALVAVDRTCRPIVWVQGATEPRRDGDPIPKLCKPRLTAAEREASRQRRLERDRVRAKERRAARAAARPKPDLRTVPEPAGVPAPVSVADNSPRGEVIGMDTAPIRRGHCPEDIGEHGRWRAVPSQPPVFSGLGIGRYLDGVA